LIYQVRHITEYVYEVGAISAKLALHLTPRSGAGQNCLAHDIIIDPQPQQFSSDADFFGNIVTHAAIERPLVRLRISATSRLDVDRSAPPADLDGPAWDAIVRAAAKTDTAGPDSPVHFMFKSRRIGLDPAITTYAAQSFAPGTPIIGAIRDFARRIRDDFEYVPNATNTDTPMAQAFMQRRGVCQDFSHIMIAGLRGLGLPAAYVSGYIRTLPPPGMPRIVGGDASHAWVSVWCGENQGWLDIDPTNACDAGNDHIVVARGRDFSDVSPIYGVFLGSGAQSLSVSVDVAPEDEAPSAS